MRRHGRLTHRLTSPLRSVRRPGTFHPGLEWLEARCLLASDSVRLVADIAQGTESAEPIDRIVLGDALLYSANDGVHGYELWRTDGTEAGTFLLKDTVPGPEDLAPNYFTRIGDTVFFRNGFDELWKTDGTSEGTVLVKAIHPDNLAASEDRLFFTVTTFEHLELWKSDGTTEGTVFVATLGDRSDVYIYEIASIGSDLYFSLVNDADFSNLVTLWKSDGTAEGTVPLTLLETGNELYSPSYFKVMGDELFFSASVITGGEFPFSTFDTELWATDGTIEGTRQVVDLKTEGEDTSSNPRGLQLFDGELYFTADGDGGSGLWKTDGTQENTILVWEGFDPWLSQTANALYWFTGNATAGYDLWTGDGNPSGSQFVEHIAAEEVSELREFVGVGDTFYFVFHVENQPGQLWKSGGTSEGTHRVATLEANYESPRPQSLLAFGDTLIFSAFDDYHGRELWTSDGTESGTSLLFDTNQVQISSNVTPLGSYRGMLYFFIEDRGGTPQFWKTDGADAGTVLLKEGIYPSAKSDAVEWNGLLYFLGSEGLWRTDGTPEGTLRVNAGFISSATQLTWVGDLLFFSGGSTRTLWKSDGTLEGTVLVKSAGPGPLPLAAENLTAVGNVLYFSSNGSGSRVLWKTDGTPEGTAIVKNVAVPGQYQYQLEPSSVFPASLVAVDGQLYFIGIDAANGSELWRSDGTETGTVRLTDISLGSANSLTGPLVLAGNSVYFSANTSGSTNTFDIWKYDSGSEEPSRIDVRFRAPTFTPEALVAYGDGVLFVANVFQFGLNTGIEIWANDGTSLEIELLADVSPDDGSSNPEYLRVFGDGIYFTADDGTNGVRLWHSDGAAEGTALVHDPDLVENPREPGPTFRVGSLLYFVGKTEETGRELFVLDRRTPGDANNDGLVNEADYSVWADHFLESPTSSLPYSQGDFNRDGLIDAADYTLWADHFEASTATATTGDPSPASAASAASIPADSSTVTAAVERAIRPGDVSLEEPHWVGDDLLGWLALSALEAEQLAERSGKVRFSE